MKKFTSKFNKEKSDNNGNPGKRGIGKYSVVIKPAICIILILMLVISPFSGGLATSLSNQEFFSYHLRDLLGIADASANSDYYYLSTGTYENTTYGELFGTAKGRNLIVIQVESLQNIMLNREYEGQEITPNLNELIARDDTLYFSKYYQQLGSGNTSDSEFVTNNSLIGSIACYTYNLYQNNYFKGLPWILKENGYSTSAFHANDKTFWNRENAYPRMGFDQFINSDYFVNDHLIGSGKIQGASDKSMFAQSIEPLKEMTQPFYGFFVTLSSHHPFELPEELQEINLKEEDKGDIFGDYINAVHYADAAIGEFIQELKDAGLYDNSIIAIYGDHSGLSSTDEEIYERVSEFIGSDYLFMDQMNIPLVINIPGDSACGGTYDIVGGEVDFLPTIAYLLGIEDLDTLYLGQNLITAAEGTGFVAEQTYMLKGSYFTDDLMFEISRDGVISHSNVYDMHTKEKLDVTEEMIELSGKAKQIIELSNFYLENDVLSLAIKDGMTIDEILEGADSTSEMPDYIADPGLPGSSSVQEFGEQLARMSRMYDDGYDYIIAYVENENLDEYYITPDELLSWMNTHKDAIVLVRTGDDEVLDVLSTINELVDIQYTDYFTSSNGAETSSSQAHINIGDKIIPVLETMKNYTKTQYAGYNKILFMPDINNYKEKDFSDFFSLNSPWALAVYPDYIEMSEQKLDDYDGFVYVQTKKGDGSEQEEEYLKNDYIDGIITRGMKS